MRHRRLLGLAVVALALAALISLLAKRAVEAPAGHAAPATRPVIAAARALNVGVELQAADLKVVRLPAHDLPAHVYGSVKQLSGRVLTSAVVPNQVIVSEMIAQPGSGVGLPPLIPPGMRAVSVKVNDVVSVAGFALPGTHVDVLLTGNPRPNGDPGGVTTITLLKNVQVLTAGQQLEQSRNGKPEKVAVITLLVTPEGAEKLAMADGYGHLQLALRNPLDTKHEKTVPLRNASLYRLPAPPRHWRAPRRRHADPPPAAAWVVQTINGSQQAAVKFTPPAGGRP